MSRTKIVFIECVNLIYIEFIGNEEISDPDLINEDISSSICKISSKKLQNEVVPDSVNRDVSDHSLGEALLEVNDIDVELWHDLCRICAKRNDNLIPIFEEVGAHYELADKISMYLPLEVNQGDGFPQKCCHDCASSIVSWNDMVVCSEKAFYKLDSIRLNYISRNFHKNQKPEDEQVEKLLREEENVAQSEQDQAAAVASENIETLADSVTDLGIDIDYSNENLNLAAEYDRIVATCSSGDKSKKKQLNSDPGRLQPYKLNLPMKYITVNNRQYLRTKVFGFEPDDVPNGCEDTALYFTCCLCQETMKNEYVISHSKSHYPLQMSDSCQMCCFGFSSIDCFRNHLKKHTVYIDEEYKESVKQEGEINIVDDKDVEFNSDSNEVVSDRITEELDKVKTLDTFICEFCGMSYHSKKIFLQHIRRIHISPFFCKFCRKRFSNKNSLKHHRCILVVEKGPNNKVSWFNCKCKKIFLYEEQYIKHIETCERSKYLTCHECGREFSNKAKLDFHVLNFHITSDFHIKLKELEEKPMSVWICEICGCHLSRFSAKKHYMTHLFMEKKFTCDKCDMKFIDKIALDKHAQTHSDLRPFSCDICKATFKRKDHVKMHMKKKHNVNDGEKKFECRKCKRFFTTNSYLIRHQRLHSQGVSYECAVCRSRFPTEHSLKMHQTRTKHDSGMENKDNASVSLSTADWVNRYRCSICNQRYGSMASLKKHSLIHVRTEKDDDATAIGSNKSEVKVDGVSKNEEGLIENKQNKLKIIETIFQCPKCSKRYLSEFGLKLHLTRTKHAPVNLKAKKRLKSSVPLPKSEKNSRFKCNVCNENFSTLLSLKMHKIKCKHFSKCPNCDKRFALDFKLRNHLIKVHNRKDIDEVNEFTLAEIRPHECNICHQKFAMNHNLLAHMQRKHSANETPPINVIYIDSDIFNQKTADGETPVVYHCTDCRKNFFTEDDFRNHCHDTSVSEDTSMSVTSAIDLISEKIEVDTEIAPVVKNDSTIIHVTDVISS